VCSDEPANATIAIDHLEHERLDFRAHAPQPVAASRLAKLASQSQ
jgi:hypothetical protein